jgi:Replication-relaxation
VSPERRVTEAHVLRLAERLQPRDLAVVMTLDRVRVATAKQLQRLHFADGTPQANARQAQRRLRALTEPRVLTVLDRRVGGTGGGSAQPVYALDVGGQRLASACGPAGGVRIRRPWTPGQAFLRHAVAVTELYVGLAERARAGSGALAAFDAEPGCWRLFTGPASARAWLKPDAFVRWLTAEHELATFVEVDRATASLPTLGRKLTVYRRYWQTGREQERFGLFPKVLVLVPSERRKQAVVEMAARQPPDAWPLFQVVRYDDGVRILAGETP